jgi:predicted permease
MNWWRRLLRRRRVETELDAELRDHLERQVADYMRDGMTEADARRRARLEFGGLDQVKELCRDARGTRLVEELMQDAAYAGRLFRKNPAFSATAILTLALGIGANISVFTLIDALLLRPLPVRDPDGLVAIWRVPHAEHFSYPQVQHLAEQRHLVATLCAFGTDVINAGPPEAVESIGAAWVTGNFHETLGLVPAAGRLLTVADDRAGAVAVAVITDEFWSRKYGRDPRIVGGSIIIDGRPVTVVGVTPPRFLGAVIGEAADITLPVNARAQLQPERPGYLDDDSRWLRILARPREGVSRDDLTAQLDVIWSLRMKATVPQTLSADVRNRMLSSTLDVVSGRAGASSLRGTFRKPLLAAMALVALVLLIACVNVATLLLARATAREREVALRLAIGAGRARIARQMLTESALLALAGTAIGFVLGSLGTDGLVGLLASGPTGPDSSGTLVLDLSFDSRMFAFTSAIVVVTTIVFGIAPAMRTARAAPITALNAGSSRIADSRRGAAAALVTAQITLSLLVLVAAGLFARTLYNLRTLDRGFRHDGVLVVEIDTARGGYKGEALNVFNRDLLDFAEDVPGVQSATVASITPLRGGGISLPMLVNGQRAEIYLNNVGPRYFETLATPVVAGREFTLRDDRSAPPVAIVNQAFVRAYVADSNPLGQRVTASGGIERQVVGVVRDAVYETLRQAPPPTVYVPFLQSGGRSGGDIGVTLIVYAPGSLDDVASRIRAYVQPRLGGRPPRVRTLTGQLERSIARERLMATIASLFGAVALTLAAVGIYGLLAFWVARRTQEIGIRLALGARRSSVMRLVLRDALRMLLLGAIIGVPSAWALARFISSLLFGLTPTDVPTLAGATTMLLLTGLAAALLPARRATEVNPIAALRYE